MAGRMVSRLLCSVIALSLYTIVTSHTIQQEGPPLPVFVGTWLVQKEIDAGWEILKNGGTAVDAVVEGCTVCEMVEGGAVGYGGDPDEKGETTLDAMVFDGETHDVGAVGGLRRIKNAVGVARKVMENTKHTFLVGESATLFGIEMGFQEETLQTNDTDKQHKEWKDNNCQPNFWKNVEPDPSQSCGPYKPLPSGSEGGQGQIDKDNHDTITLLAISEDGKIAAATSTNGLNHKIPGRVGDSPIPGAGNYVDRAVGAAGATGDGDILLRFMPSLITVEGMRSGLSPSDAADSSLARIEEFYPGFSGAVIAVSKDGSYGAGCRGMESFPYTVKNVETGQSTVLYVTCKKTHNQVP